VLTAATSDESAGQQAQRATLMAAPRLQRYRLLATDSSPPSASFLPRAFELARCVAAQKAEPLPPSRS